MSDDQTANTTVRRLVAASARLCGPTTRVMPANNENEARSKRFSLDYATWRARIAAPGSRFEPEQPVEPQIVRLVPVRRAADLPEVEQRTA